MILPGSTIGIFGGGQLGRMTALAARSLGYRIATLDPDPECPAKPVSDRLVTAPFDDANAAEELARGCDVVTIEIEHIAPEALERAARHAPVRPGAEVLRIIQDRQVQRAWLAEHGFPCGPWRSAASAAEIRDAVAGWERGAYVKATRGGYDGRGQVRVDGGHQADAAWSALGGRAVIVEQALTLELEISVMVARGANGNVVAYPPAQNHHERQVLAWSVLPAPIDDVLAERAVDIARGVADQLGVIGLLAVEFFVAGGDLLVNELAPRPHNSYHESELACPTSQFEQLVRAVCGLPLGAARAERPAAIVNLLGDLWTDGQAPHFEHALAMDSVRLTLYGKAAARMGRKMGHLAATAPTPGEAVERVLAAKRAVLFT
ncbi:MAG: 5-(carboxyamino)imidazole ribonucleotide synthase [Gemmatimonadaceae bacterium]